MGKFNLIRKQKAPSAADLDAVAAEQKAKQATTPSFRTGVAGGPLNPSIDSDKHDSLGSEKQETAQGPRGDNAPLDVLTDEQKKAADKAAEAKLAAGMSSTDHKDSIGNLKGTATEPHQPLIGPRGTGAPKESYSSLKK